MDQPGIMGHEKALPPLQSGANFVLSVLTGRLAAVRNHLVFFLLDLAAREALSNKPVKSGLTFSLLAVNSFRADQASCGQISSFSAET